jgi:Cdc6-like AAA superfamily ATPase
MTGLRGELEKTLPSVGIVLNTAKSITLTGRNIPDTIIEAIKHKQRKDIDSQRLMNYFDELRRRFPDISEATLLQMLSLIEGENVRKIQEFLSEKDANIDTVVKTGREPQPNFRNPYNTGLPIDAPGMFFGREQILKKIINGLHNNNFIVTGPRRIGKTTLLHQLKNRLAVLDDPDYHFVPIFVDVQGVLERVFFYRVMNQIVRERLPEYLSTSAIPILDFNQTTSSAYDDGAFGGDLGKIIKVLQQNYPNKTVKLVLLMDEMDVMNTYDQRVQSQLRSIFIRFAQDLRAVVTGVNLDQEWKRQESPFYNMFSRIVLGPLSPEEAQQLIIQPVKDIYRYDDEAITRILAATEGHPFRLQQLCKEVIERVTEEKRKQVTLADVEATLAYIQSAEEEAKKPDDETLTQPVPVAPTILAERRATYNDAPPTSSEEESE